MAVLAIGSTGDEVRAVQQALVDRGYFVGEVDSDYGVRTAAAVAYLQSCHGLDIDSMTGDQTRDILDIGGAVSLGVHAVWPDLDIWAPGDDFIVNVEALGGDFSDLDVRVVLWFRGSSGEEHTELTVSLKAGSTTDANFVLPEQTVEAGGEVHYTGYVFSMDGVELSDEGAGSFHIDDPMARM